MAFIRSMVTRVAQTGTQAFERVFLKGAQTAGRQQRHLDGGLGQQTLATRFTQKQAWFSQMMRSLQSHQVSLVARQLRSRLIMGGSSRLMSGGIGRYAGTRLPLLAFVAFNMGPRGADMTQDDLDTSFENVCNHIKMTFSQKSVEGDPLEEDFKSFVGRTCSLSELKIGKMIGRGRNSAVYSVEIKQDVEEKEGDEDSEHVLVDDTESDITILDCEDEETDTACLDDLEEEYVFVDEHPPFYFNIDNELEMELEESLGGFNSIITIATDSDVASDEEADVMVLSAAKETEDFEINGTNCKMKSPPPFSLPSTFIWENGEEPPNEGGEMEDEIQHGEMESYSSVLTDYSENEKLTFGQDFALKVMYEPWVNLDSFELEQALGREMVPMTDNDRENKTTWRNGNHVKNKRLKPHPNIADIYGGFSDDLQNHPDLWNDLGPCHSIRYNTEEETEGSQANCLLLKRYTSTLFDNLYYDKPNVKQCCLLLAQLLEAVAHLERQQVVHRNIGTENILLGPVRGDEDCRHLVLANFGRCLAEERGTKIPYVTEQIHTGGNKSLMAPEISTAVFGLDRDLDFTKADVWAVGGVAYEIFGRPNPFRCHGNPKQQTLRSRNYGEEDLPELPDEVPQVVKNMIKTMLRRDPRQRPSAQQLVTALQSWLWLPSEWFLEKTPEGNPSLPSNIAIMRQLQVLSAETLLQRSNLKAGRWNEDSGVMSAECRLKHQYLSTLDINRVRDALQMLLELC